MDLCLEIGIQMSTHPSFDFAVENAITVEEIETMIDRLIEKKMLLENKIEKNKIEKNIEEIMKNTREMKPEDFPKGMNGVHPIVVEPNIVGYHFKHGMVVFDTKHKTLTFSSNTDKKICIGKFTEWESNIPWTLLEPIVKTGFKIHLFNVDATVYSLGVQWFKDRNCSFVDDI